MASTSAPLYSFVLIHYKQEQYIFTALDSIFSQTYPHIELVVVDDGTPAFNASRVLDYVEKHKSKNIARFELIANEQNLGTVQAANRAMAATTGEFLQLFAADDRLANEQVAQNFATCFSDLGGKAQIISARTSMYDRDLEVITHPFMTDGELFELNGMSAKEQYWKAMEVCAFAMGSTCLRRALWDQYGPFDTTWRLIEDWPFFIKITRANVKVFMADFAALDHRAGGVTGTNSRLSETANTYKNEFLSIFEDDVLLHLRQEPIDVQLSVYGRYQTRYDEFKESSRSLRHVSFFRILRHSPVLAASLVWNKLVSASSNIIRRGAAGAFISAAAIALSLLIASLADPNSFTLFGLSPASFFAALVTPFYIVFLLFLCAVAFGVLFKIFFGARELLKKWSSKLKKSS